MAIIATPEYIKKQIMALQTKVTNTILPDEIIDHIITFS
jgi:hypothetical protein